jgi:hypothetical protein
MTMLMIISIAVVLVMASLCAYLAVLSRDQLTIKEYVIQYAEIDASSSAISYTMSNQIKEDLNSMYPGLDLPPEPDSEPVVLNQNDFINAYNNAWQHMVKSVSVANIKNITITYDNDTEIYVHNSENQHYGSCVITVEYDNSTVNYAFFLEETNRDGFEKGDFISLWIS